MIAVDQLIEARRAVRTIIAALGEDPDREGLLDTPRRVVDALHELTRPQTFTFRTFAAEKHDQMIVQTDIQFYSLCEHHMLPFFGTAAVAYIPDGTIAGLSKLSRTVEFFARRLQNQERLTDNIADFIAEKLNPRGVAVSLRARHLCQEMRGARKPDTWTTTTALRGAMKEGVARAEFLSYIRP